MLLPDKVPSNDKGDDVQLRFRYQYSYTCLLAMQMYSRQIDLKEIFCEQHEDILGVSLAGKYTGIQIKTREKPIPFSLSDQEIKKSIKRFIQLEGQYPDEFVSFVIVSNCGFKDELNYDIEKILNTEEINSHIVQLRRKVKRYIHKISEECATNKSNVYKVLCKLKLQTGPSLFGADSKIIEAHLGNLPECKDLNLEDLRQILDQIRQLVYNASSKRLSERISDYISFLIDGSKTTKKLEIEGKRITINQIGDIIKKNTYSITQTNRKKDSSLELVDIDIVDDKRDTFPLLDIKIRNIGYKIAVLKKAELHVYRTWTLKNPWMPRAMRISCNYDVLLPVFQYPAIETISLSQAVKPNEADRFTITLGNDEPPGPNQFVYQLRILLVYDGNNKTIQSSDLFVLSRRPSIIRGAHSIHSHMERCKEYNKAVLSELKDLNGIKSRSLHQIITQHLHNGEVA